MPMFVMRSFLFLSSRREVPEGAQQHKSLQMGWVWDSSADFQQQEASLAARKYASNLSSLILSRTIREEVLQTLTLCSGLVQPGKARNDKIDLFFWFGWRFFACFWFF